MISHDIAVIVHRDNITLVPRSCLCDIMYAMFCDGLLTVIVVRFNQSVYMVEEGEEAVVLDITREQGTTVIPLNITLRTLDVNFTATGVCVCVCVCVCACACVL